MATRSAGDLVHRKTLEFAEEHDCTYQRALHEVLNANPSLKVLYAGVETKPSLKTGHSAVKDVSGTVHEQVKQFMVKTGEKDYGTALRAVLRNDEALALEYLSYE